MKKRTLVAGQYQRHYATNGILMYRERKNLVDLPEGTLVTVLKARRQSHLCSIRMIEREGALVLGNGKHALDICIAIPAANLPKIKIEGEAKAKGKGKRNTAPVVTAEPAQAEQPAGLGPQDVQPAAEQAAPAEQPAPAAEAPAPAVEAAPAPEAAPAEQPVTA